MFVNLIIPINNYNCFIRSDKKCNFDKIRYYFGSNRMKGLGCKKLDYSMIEWLGVTHEFSHIIHKLLVLVWN